MQAVVLVSGGMDSAALLHYVVKRLGCTAVHALTYRYGQKHEREIEMAACQCRSLTQVTDWKIVDISVLGEMTAGASALTDSTIAVPDLEAIPEEQLSQPPTYVPNRNMVLISLAAAYGESRGCETVFYGAQAQDKYGYWDCTAEFLERLNHVLSLNRRQPISVQAPFVAMRKAEELAIGLELGVDFSRTWSCYRGGTRACGQCPSCRERLQAFNEVGVPDPIEYERC